MLEYPISLRKDGDNYLATCKDFPELTTFGEDKADALLHAVDALEEAIAGRIADREAIPEPSKGRHKVRLSTQVAVTVALHRRMLRMGVRKAELARRLHCHAPQIDRLLDINHASKLEQFDAAMNALDSYLEVRAA